MEVDMALAAWYRMTMDAAKRTVVRLLEYVIRIGESGDTARLNYANTEVIFN